MFVSGFNIFWDFTNKFAKLCGTNCFLDDKYDWVIYRIGKICYLLLLNFPQRLMSLFYFMSKKHDWYKMFTFTSFERRGKFLKDMLRFILTIWIKSQLCIIKHPHIFHKKNYHKFQLECLQNNHLKNTWMCFSIQITFSGPVRFQIKCVFINNLTFQ